MFFILLVGTLPSGNIADWNIGAQHAQHTEAQSSQTWTHTHIYTHVREKVCIQRSKQHPAMVRLCKERVIYMCLIYGTHMLRHMCAHA